MSAARAHVPAARTWAAYAVRGLGAPPRLAQLTPCVGLDELCDAIWVFLELIGILPRMRSVVCGRSLGVAGTSGREYGAGRLAGGRADARARPVLVHDRAMANGRPSCMRMQKLLNVVYSDVI